MAIFTFDDDDTQAARKDMQQPSEIAMNVDDVFATDKMDMALPNVPLQVGTPPIAIASPLPKRAVQPNLEAKQQGPDKLDFNAVMKKAQKNKKKKKKVSQRRRAGRQHCSRLPHPCYFWRRRVRCLCRCNTTLRTRCLWSSQYHQ